MARKNEGGSNVEPRGMRGLLTELLDAQTQLVESVERCWKNFERIERMVGSVGEKVARIDRRLGPSDDYRRMVR